MWQSAVSLKREQFLIRRFCEKRRFNGVCLGRVLCVDNLGKDYDRESLSRQLKFVLSDVTEIRFAGVELHSQWHPWGWCCIEFLNTDAAVAALEILDDVYLRTVTCPHILRPILPHFPIWEPETESQIESRNDHDALSLGQITTVNHEGKEFERLWNVIRKTKTEIMTKIENALLPLMKSLEVPKECHVDSNAPPQRKNDDRRAFPGIWLKNVPGRVTDAMISTFFQCSDKHVELFYVSDPVFLNHRQHVIVHVSTRQKALYINQDIQQYMLLHEGFMPLAASVVDFQKPDGFESLFDRAMMNAGIDDGAFFKGRTELVQMKEAVRQNEKIAKKIKSVLDDMQHSRSACRRMQRAKEEELRRHLDSKIDEIHKRFSELVGSINTIGRHL